MEKWKDESGVIMVEASIYFPIVIFTVFAMIYFGMMKYQESILTFQVQKQAVMAGREVAYPGYEAFTRDGSKESVAVDFTSGSDFSSGVESYYKQKIDHLYHEWQFEYGAEQQRIEGELKEILNRCSFLTGVEADADVTITNYVIGRQIKAKATYGLKSPRLLEIVGVPLDLTLHTTVTQSASNPAELVRNVDLATDLINFLLERFNVKDRVDSFLKKAEDIKNKIL